MRGVYYMDNSLGTINQSIYHIKNLIGNNNQLIIKSFIIGKNNCFKGAIIYIDGFANKDMIDRDILNPLMLHIEEDLSSTSDIENYLCEKYIAISNVQVEPNINNAVNGIKRGKTALLIEGSYNFIMADTTGGEYRSISEPINELSIRGPREGFVENLQTNVTILSRKLKDKNLATEKFTLGRRNQVDLVLMYIGDIVDKNLLARIRDKINSIDVDSVSGGSFVEQFIEEHPYSIFPQFFGSERPDVIQSKLLEGRIVFLLQGTPYIISFPTTLPEFFQTPEDYYMRTIVSSVSRIIRLIAIFIAITLPSIYLTLVKFNAELIPLDFVEALISSRKGIALTPFMSMLAMNLTIEFLREGGLRLPGKIGQTLSVVGGIIIGDAAMKAKMVDSTTLLVVGITTVATFLIPYYHMALSIRLITYPMLLLADVLGVLGIVVGWFFILAYLSTLESFGVPYLSFYKDDMKDTFIRAPLWKMNKRPKSTPNNNPIKQNDFRKIFRRNKNE